jgi:hypothetical protein
LSEKKKSRWRLLLPILSFLFPVVGITVGIWYLPRMEPEDIRLGKTSFILGIISLLLYMIACFGLVALGLGSRILGEF